MNSRLRNTSLGQQLAVAAALLCLVVSLALVTLGAISSKHMQAQLQQSYGSSLAQLIARSVSTAMESGDLLSVSASLQRFVSVSAADQVVLTGVDGKELGQAGNALSALSQRYTAEVYIDQDVAGRVTVTLDDTAARAAQRRFVLSLLGLAILLSLTAYGAARQLGQRVGKQLRAMARSITLAEEEPGQTPANEVQALSHQIAALPMDLLRTRSEPRPQDENYQTTAVLYLHLTSLSGYVDTLDEASLQRYTNQLHQVVYAAAGFYAGDLQVARQFGLAVYFSGHSKAGTAAFRAASCAWLVRAVCRELEQQMSLSMNIAMAISQSELGVGNADDIYPGLYMQHTLDELALICASKPPQLLLSPKACEDLDIASRLQVAPTDVGDYALIEEFAGSYRDLLERQLRLIMKRLTDPAVAMR
ncbi:MAG: hypothetical protein KDI09_06025 [Halioglobus sp.]|nr:hypothetical protein [Halioglobus sp.]